MTGKPESPSDLEINRDAMSLRELVAWVWRNTDATHRNPWNLLIHLICAPLFVLAHLLIVLAMLSGSLSALFMGLVSIASSMVSQQFGHLLEEQQQPAYSGARDVFVRIYCEQFYTFWRFLLSGKWVRHYRVTPK